MKRSKVILSQITEVASFKNISPFAKSKEKTGEVETQSIKVNSSSSSSFYLIALNYMPVAF